MVLRLDIRLDTNRLRTSSLDPLVPLCPLQPLKGFGDPNSDFEHGYTIGYKQGTVRGSR